MAFEQGRIDDVTAYLESGLEHMNLDKKYIDRNYIFYWVDEIPEEHQDKMFKYLIEHGCDYSISADYADNLLSSVRDIRKLFYGAEEEGDEEAEEEAESGLKWWVQEFIRLDAESESPVLIRPNERGYGYYDLIYSRDNFHCPVKLLDIYLSRPYNRTNIEKERQAFAESQKGYF
jgi:hypothetical protein